ncbi:glycoside hydrolase family 13 protein [Thermotalea metallivorans]|uniref:Amylopullulanase n=1 Tax=Thermotalea metallivorans TaxID=520762 RepID=A0A140L3Z6_9FIRM|nr:glycoside hydrolase family 13 protein [Thermotalea metallivorans]KXG75271.1 Amylopullulanase [Thermotalea metallivorans]
MNDHWILHDSHQAFFRKPFGAVPCRQRISIRISLQGKKEEILQIILRLWDHQEGERKIPMVLCHTAHDQKSYETEISAPAAPGLLWYYFIITTREGIYFYGNNQNQTGGVGQIYLHEPPSYQITVYKEGATIPHWFASAVMYQIFPDRFYNGCENGEILNPKTNAYIYPDWNAPPAYIRDEKTGRIRQYDFFGGNLQGILKKLPYLKSLGIDVIYLNPVFESPSNHRYDTANYKKIDPMLGDNEFFRLLCAKAREQGISIILDGVFSHTGSDSIYFNKEGNYPELGAYQSKDSPYYPWYRFIQYPDVYECWWGIDTLPNVHEMEPSYQNFIIHQKDSVINYWMGMGVKGWRLDVADELPGAFIKALRKRIKENDPDALLIGEVWEDASRKTSYGELREYLLGEELDSVMNYPFRNILLDFMLGRKDSFETHGALMSLYENYPLHHFYAAMNLIGSHDVPRILTLLGEAPDEILLTKEEREHYKLSTEQKKKAVARLKMLSLLQMTFPGVPCIYYGDEAGVEGYNDPLNRRTYPWGQEDQELLEWYRKIISFRHRYDALTTGEWISLPLHQDVYGYLRRIANHQDVLGQKKENSSILVLINRNLHHSVSLSFDASAWGHQPWKDLLADDKETLVVDGLLHIALKPLEGKIMVQQP